ncbi:hypothetical protein BDR05DRAFT_995869 [Suillus weaverae]|nr:hypothetical protein BDR05DRAFT_995869 [Suillus weaverae]
MPIHHKSVQSSADTSEGPSKSSLSDDETIGPSPNANPLFPTIPKPTFTLRPAIFEPETPTAPSTSETILPAKSLPPIPKPDFLFAALAPPAQPQPTQNTSTTAPSTLPNPFAPRIPAPPIPSKMSNASKGINAMPGTNSSKAPSFNGETSELLEFFELFEDLADACALTPAEKCKMIVQYVDIQTKRFWVTLTGYESRDFSVFKDSILAQYSGAAKGQRYTI